MFVTLKEYVSMLSWVYICVGDGPKRENCFYSTPLVLCCSFSLKKEREIRRKRTGWVIWTWVQFPDLSEPLWWVGAWIKLNTLDFLTNYNCRSRKWFLPLSFTDHSHMFILAELCLGLTVLACLVLLLLQSLCRMPDALADNLSFSLCVHLLGWEWNTESSCPEWTLLLRLLASGLPKLWQ